VNKFIWRKVNQQGQQQKDCTSIDLRRDQHLEKHELIYV